MKKFAMLFILAAVCVSTLFAHPDIPVINNSLDTTTCFRHISDNGQNQYMAQILISDNNFTFRLTNESLVTKVKIKIVMSFKSESELNSYVNNIDVADIEKVFETIRYKIRKAGIKPTLYTDDNLNIEQCIYYIH